MNLTETQIQMFEGKICPYCRAPSVFVDSKEVYGKSYGMIYLCRPCRAWVGVHKGSEKALGRLANWNLRRRKKKAHSYFDQIWRDGHMTRAEAYSWLSKNIGLDPGFTHIGMMNDANCEVVAEVSKQFLNDMRRLDLDFGAEPKTEHLP